EFRRVCVRSCLPHLCMVCVGVCASVCVCVWKVCVIPPSSVEEGYSSTLLHTALQSPLCPKNLGLSHTPNPLCGVSVCMCVCVCVFVCVCVCVCVCMCVLC